MNNFPIPLKVHRADPSNYGGKLTGHEYIVVHYTANDGDTDENNGEYYGRPQERKASAHLFVDDDSCTSSVPLESIAYHCGATVYKHPYCRNHNSIGVEICDDIRNGIIYPSQKTIENTLAVVRWLMAKYNIPKERVIRHYDVTGKLCPAYWVDDAKWKAEFHDRLEDEEMTQEQFDKMMDTYLAKRAQEPCSAWAKPELAEAKQKGITDGTSPKAFATREEVAAMVLRAIPKNQ